MYIYLKSFRSINNEYLVSLFEKIDEENTHDTREGGEEIGGSVAEKDENVYNDRETLLFLPRILTLGYKL